MATYEKGLVEVGDGIHAYLQPDGSWGWSNAGLVAGAGESLLIDTLFDLRLTKEMLDAMAPMTGAAPISTVVNTHANGDHCYGNQLLAGPGMSFVSSAATARELADVPAHSMRQLVELVPPGPLASFVADAFGPFDFDGIDVPPMTETFEGRQAVRAGGRRVELIQVGPAHTAGDTLVWLPDDGILFAGDILFIGGTPVMWAGPISGWIAACDLIEELTPRVVVPGHGPLTDASGARDVGDYLRTVRDGVVARHAEGMSPGEAARDLDAEIDDTPFGGWGDRERLVVTVHQMWRELEPGYEPPDTLVLLQMMAEAYTSRP
ncbi:MAG TPA: MBL fold metallo-hydrolase [Acidimicrobiales bacterium]|jgi:glyoxylase-like metal-dependent hydrolase (beta-lactamase superfamily II)|nr:MBL fold metallo-hydrolase [Acidimicrobiales bacterium]